MKRAMTYAGAVQFLLSMIINAKCISSGFLTTEVTLLSMECKAVKDANNRCIKARMTSV